MCLKNIKKNPNILDTTITRTYTQKKKSLQVYRKIQNMYQVEVNLHIFWQIGMS